MYWRAASRKVLALAALARRVAPLCAKYPRAVVLHEGKILDGRNRCRAAREAGVPCPTRIYQGDDPLGFVISMNLKRGHLNESQRAMAAARIANMPAHRPPSIQETSLYGAREKRGYGHGPLLHPYEHAAHERSRGHAESAKTRLQLS
jgi:hypothetical protein